MILACRRRDYHLPYLRRLDRPSGRAYITLRLHLSPDEARLGLSGDPQIPGLGKVLLLRSLIQSNLNIFDVIIS